MDGRSFQEKLEEALRESLSFSGYSKQSENPAVQNSLRSSYFCYKVVEKLSDTPDLNGFCPKTIKVDKEGVKTAGEWLLDAVWCKGSKVWQAESKRIFPTFIRAALECESDTSERDFFIDFAKLTHIRSDIKIFLGGVNQKSRDNLLKYIEKRREQAGKFITECRENLESTEWFLAFWPSPGKLKNSQYNSLWDELGKRSDDTSHLSSIYAYKLRGNFFEEIRED